MSLMTLTTCQPLLRGARKDSGVAFGKMSKCKSVKERRKKKTWRSFSVDTSAGLVRIGIRLVSSFTVQLRAV